MQGTILIIDPVSTNRIMLKVLLSAAWYRVVQADRIGGLSALLHRVRPDLIVTAMALPDGDAIALRSALLADPATALIPIIAITAQNDRTARLRALAAGIDDVLGQPLNDTLLQARIRNLLRIRSSAEELRQDGIAPESLGFADAAAGFVSPVRSATVALVTREAATGAIWRNRLKAQAPHHLTAYRLGAVQDLLSEPVPQAIVVELAGAAETSGLRLLADLRARSATRQAAVIAIGDPSNPRLAAEALDRGAHDVLADGFCAEELALRLAAQLRRKARSDHLRDTLRDGLLAAVRDPLTGLYNRRHALPHLAQVARDAAGSGRCFAVMLADLDHFKRINDRYGHPAGDAVLAEAARRMQATLRPVDMIARVGGEEFLIVMPDTGAAAAARAADRLCRAIDGTAFQVSGADAPVHVTTSIGVVAGPYTSGVADQTAANLIFQADRALYDAKGAGRNQVSLARPAA